jgi:glutathione S-transferase
MSDAKLISSRNQSGTFKRSIRQGRYAPIRSLDKTSRDETLSQVPVLAYGGPKTPLDDPSSETVKIAESLVLVEFVNDLSGGKLLPEDPVLRAKARLFIDTVSPKVISAFFGPCLRGDDPQIVVQAIELLQSLLPEGDGYAVGDWSIADAAVVTLLARTELALENDYGAYDEGTGKKAWDEVMNAPRFERFRKYYAAVKARKSFQETFARVSLTLSYLDFVLLIPDYSGFHL